MTVSVKDVSKRFNDQVVLSHVNLACNPGEICGIVGYNGSGKTVLFKTICGFFHPDSGEILVDGKCVNGTILTDAGIVIDGSAFLENLSGIQNLELLWTLRHKKDRAHLEEMMRKVGLDPKLKKKVGKYSMGMKQRLAIAQAIMEDQPILIFDEAFNGLDKTGLSEMRSLIQSLKTAGRTILLASHNKDDIDLLCDQVYEMEAGVLTKVK